MLILMLKYYERKILFYILKIVMNKIKRTWLKFMEVTDQNAPD